MEALLAETIHTQEGEVLAGGGVESYTSRGVERAPPEEGDSQDRLFSEFMGELEREEEEEEAPLHESLFLGSSQELAEVCGWGSDVNAFFNIWAPQLSDIHTIEEAARPEGGILDQCELPELLEYDAEFAKAGGRVVDDDVTEEAGEEEDSLFHQWQEAMGFIETPPAQESEAAPQLIQPVTTQLLRPWESPELGPFPPPSGHHPDELLFTPLPPTRKRPAKTEAGPPAKRLPGECGMFFV